MKKILFLFFTLSFMVVNAQIFINTNPNSKDNSGTIEKANTVVDETKKELKTTKTNEENFKTNYTSPNYSKKEKIIETPKVSTENSTITTTTTPNVNSTNINTSNVSGTTVTSGSTTYSSTNNSLRNTTSSTSSMNAGGGDVPPNAQPGKCYARCQTEDQYAFNSKEIINTPRMTKRIQLPALYSTVYDTVIIKPQSYRTERIPAQYETVKQQKMVSPSTTKWVKGKADKGCLSANPDDCQVMCLVEVPAQYTTITKRIIKQVAYTRQITIPMEYKIVAKQIKVKDASYSEQIIPPTYKTVKERVLVKKGAYQGWREVLCGSDLTDAKISSIQRALRAAGYNPGPIDNIFGTKTKEALKSYQRAKGLPVGNLNIETLRSLGV